MSGVAFVDSNVLIHAHDLDAGVKRERAVAKLRELWNSGGGRLSVQVLQEFYVNVTQKLATPVARSTAREIVKTYGVWVRRATTVETIAGQSIVGIRVVNPLNAGSTGSEVHDSR